MTRSMEKQIETYLYENIPITLAMGIQVKHASSQKIILFAPLSNNINHKKTVFGGSLHAVATVACWSLLFVNVREAKEGQVQIVITKSDVDYLAPVEGDFYAECLLPKKEIWDRFQNMLHMKGKARINLSAKIEYKGRLAVDYRGTFAAIS